MLRKLLGALAITCFAGLASIDAASAQIQPIRGSGCPDAPFPRVSGPARIGHPFALRCPPCRDNQAGFVVLGTTLRDGFAFRPPVTCVRGPCVLACRPITVLLPADGWTVRIPNARDLVGVCICAQCGCLDRQHRCLTLSGALRICIQR